MPSAILIQANFSDFQKHITVYQTNGNPLISITLGIFGTEVKSRKKCVTGQVDVIRRLI